jgi:hypothetical protein
VPPEHRAVTHRAALLLLDGLTQEMEAEDYQAAFRPKDVSLLVLNIKVRPPRGCRVPDGSGPPRSNHCQLLGRPRKPLAMVAPCRPGPSTA